MAPRRLDHGVVYGGCGERTPVFLLAQLATLALIFWVTIGTPFVPSAADAARDAALKPAELVYYTVEDGSTVPSALLLGELAERYAVPAVVAAVAPYYAEASRATGFHHSIFAFMIALTLNLVLAPLVNYLPSAALRHAYSSISGAGLLYFAFGVECFAWLLPCAAGTYLLMIAMPRHCGLASFALNFSAVIFVLKFRGSDKIWRAGGMDFTGTMMLFVLAMVSISFNYEDGLEYSRRAATVVLRSGGDETKTKATTEDVGGWRSASMVMQRKHHLVALPSLLEFVSYSFGLGCRLSGPTWEYSDFILWFERKPRTSIRTIASTLVRLDGAAVAAADEAAFGHNVWDATLPADERPPSAILAAIGKLVVALCFLAAHSLILAKFPVTIYNINDPLTNARGAADNRWFNASWPVRWCFLAAHSMLFRTKYAFAWGISDMAFSLAGFGTYMSVCSKLFVCSFCVCMCIYALRVCVSCLYFYELVRVLIPSTSYLHLPRLLTTNEYL